MKAKEIHLQNFLNDTLVEAGCDEAGRGPLAGAVFAAAVILPRDFHHPLLNDSKQMSEHSRDILRPIIEKEAIAWAVTAVSAREIDKLNILNASIAGMQRSVMKLSMKPDFLLIDGNRFRPFSYIAVLAAQGSLLFDDPAAEDPKAGSVEQAAEYDSIPYSCIVKGDGKFAPIAAASVLAKTYRDEYMRRLAAEYPQYGWDRNMGYPTAEHIEAIYRFGLTPYHRLSFKIKK